MRMARLLSITALLGIAMLASIRWSGTRDGDASREQTGLALEARGRDGGRPDSLRETGARETPLGDVGSSAVEGADGRRRTRDPSAIDSASPAAVAERPGLSFERARQTLRTAIESHLPGLSLSTNELDDLARATLRLRAAQTALRTIPRTREHADQRALERRRLEEAVADFTYLVEMTPAEFSRRVAPDVGVDPWSPDMVDDDVSIRPIRPIRPIRQNEAQE